MAAVAVQNLPCNNMEAGAGPVMLSQGGLAGVASYPPQYYFQQLQRPIQPHPPAQGLVSSSQGRVVEKRKRHWTKKRKQQPGSQPHHPSQLSALASKNRQRTKRHYPQGKKHSLKPSYARKRRAAFGPGTNFRVRFVAGQETPARTPRTVPRAPFNSSADLMRRQHGMCLSPSLSRRRSFLKLAEDGTACFLLPLDSFASM